METPIDKAKKAGGISQFKRSGVVALFLWFLLNSEGLTMVHVIAGALVAVVYMVLDAIKHGKGK